jgi:hypothetical protein
MNIRPTQHIAITDPREFEGDPYQVAERAIQQTRALTKLVRENVEAVNLMARNAELERQLAFGVEGQELRAAAAAWPESPQGRKIAALLDALEQTESTLAPLEKAAAFNPKDARIGRRR